MLLLFPTLFLVRPSLKVLASYDSQIDHMLQRVKENKVFMDDYAAITGGRLRKPLKMYLYESGPGGMGDATAADLALQAHRQPAMRGLVKKYLEKMATEADFITYFASCSKPSIYGNFGLIEAMDQDRSTAYKWQAVRTTWG